MKSRVMTPADGIAWVTGASSGIGAAVARELSRRGWTVAVTARRLDMLERVAADGAAPGRIVAHAGDVTDATAMRELVATIESVHGPIALAFLNAGMAPASRPFVDLDAMEQAFAVNTFGVAHSMAAVLTPMQLRGRGQIAVNASIAGYAGLPRAVAYCASKAATIGLCEALRFECEAAGIRIQLVNPGFVETELTVIRAFQKPLQIPAADAARRIADGLGRDGFEITFPRRLSWAMKLVTALPYAVYFPLMARLTGFRGGKRRGEA